MGPIVVIKGGLGNQLFQWAYAHSLQAKEPFYPAQFYFGHHYRNAHLELQSIFETCPHVLNQGDLSQSKEFVSLSAEWLWSKRFGKRLAESFFGYVQEDPRIDKPQVINSRGKAKIISGFYQKNCYSENAMGAVELEILPHAERIGAGLIASGLIPRQYSVLHIRTGEYSARSSSDQSFIGNLQEDYFLDNLDKLKAKYLIVLTENADHIPDLLNKIKPNLVLDAHQQNAWETLATMAMSESMIGANSSLSWWGAKLASLKGAKTWLPSNWSAWNNIDSVGYRFPKLNIIESSWRK
jgi:hypothetical protein